MTNDVISSSRRWGWILLGAIIMILVSAIAGSFRSASAHGAMQYPISRAYACYLEGPENPTNAACRAAKNLGGSQPFYDWNEVSRNSYGAVGEDNGYISDGHLCSADREKYKGLDLARADWPTTELPSGATVTFTYKVTEPHAGTIRFYVTNDHYHPNRPLTWSDLESTPFATYQAPAQTSNGIYEIPNVPRIAQRAC